MAYASTDDNSLPDAVDSIQALKDERTTDSTVVEQEYEGLINVIHEKWIRAKTQRRNDESRWIRAYRNFRGLYSPEVQFRENEKSRVFVKITKTKVLAAYGQLLEVLFAGTKFPVGINATEKPVGVAEYAHIDPSQPPGQDGNSDQGPQDIYGSDGDGNDPAPGATYSSLLGGQQQKLGKAGFQEGPAPDGAHMIQISPSDMAAKEMEKLIHDQLDESDASTCLRHCLYEMALLGHGVIKGPFSFERTSHRWVPDDDGKLNYSPEVKLVPHIEPVSVWNFYPDPDCIVMGEAEWVIERHSLSRTQMRALTRRPFFRANAIRDTLEKGANYNKEWFEDYLRDAINQNNAKDRYEVLEYWGTMDANMARLGGLDIADELDELDEVQINAWVCNNRILRLVLNPFTPAVIPYHACPYEIAPYQFFGIGVPENMDDCQTVMNGHARMAIDNLAFAGHMVFDVDEQALVPGQEMKIFPGKIFRRMSGNPGQAIFGLKFPSTASDNLAMFDKFRQLSDEATGIPSFSHGSTGAQSTTRTASGMSMLMGAAALNIKTVVKNIDDYLLRPIGEAFFHWNMQFNDETPEIRGDLEIKARGTSALMQKEVRSQRLMTFMQLTSNPAFAPFVKAHGLLKEIADSLDIEPEKVINDPEEAAIYARILGAAQGNPGNAQNAGTGTPQIQNGSPSGGPPDPTGAGGGNIGTGSVPQPGEPAFAASGVNSAPPAT